VTALALLAGVLAALPAAALDEVAVSVTILTYQEVDCPDDTLVPCPGDYYGKVAIGPHDFVSTPNGPVDTALHSPNWRVTQMVDRDQGATIPVRIELWDDDEDGINPDDMMDISSGDADRTLDLTLDLDTGRWTGDAGVDGTWSQGASSPRARILFDVSLSTTGDLDGDGIPDGVERFGIRRITDGSLAADLRSFGTVNPQPADPCRKTILLEIDFMTGAADGHTHAPQGPALAEVEQAFANAPVPPPFCPYFKLGFGEVAPGGVQLLIERGNAIPEAAVFTLDDLVASRSNPANFDPDRRPYIHYAVFAHDQAAGSSSSGLCCRDGKDFIVTLGSWRRLCVGGGANGTSDTTPVNDDQLDGNGNITNGADRTCDTSANAVGPADDVQLLPVGDSTSDQAGTVRDQSGTIMHELGHALGLEHRGRDDVNHAPNYLSNMSYFFQQGVPRAGAAGSVLDYSRAALPTLTEASLNETNGVQGPNTLLTLWFDPTGQVRSANAGGQIDWNQNGVIGSAAVDLNNDSACVGPGPDGTLNSTPGGDDAIANGVIHNGANDTCETTPAGDDMRITTGAGGTPINGICVGTGANEAMDSASGGDDVRFSNKIVAGPNQVCESTASGDDIQVVPVGRSEPPSHPGWDDWSNLRYRGALSASAAGQGAGHLFGDIDYLSTLALEGRFAELMDPDLRAAKTVDAADAGPGDLLTYTVTADNIGTGDAAAVRFIDTLPDGTVQQRATANIIAGRTREETFSYTVPCGTPDGTVLTNRVELRATDLQGQPEATRTNNTALAQTTIHAPVLVLDKTATPSVNAGEAITYRLTYANTGSGDAANVVVTDTLPADLYYSLALDSGAGPRPDSVTRHPDGTRTLTWNVGPLVKQSGPSVIEFTARPTLLALGGTEYRNDGSLTFTDANGCAFPPVTDRAATAITVVPATRNPRTLGYWRNHPAEWTAEQRARIQATDQRYDGRDGSVPDGALDVAEVRAAYAPGGNQPKVLQMQLLSVGFNLAGRHINAATGLGSKAAVSLGVRNVAEAFIYAQETLALPVSPATADRYDRINTVLDDINNNRRLAY
jgi:uncharacterized repeat protein (TIGR01451 family)